MSAVQVEVMRFWEYFISDFVTCRAKARSPILSVVLNSYGTRFPILHQSMRKRSCKKDWHDWLLVLLC